jgi:Uma2 family endonuclease
MATVTESTLPPAASLPPVPLPPAGPVTAASVVVNGVVHIPADIVDLESFRRWTHSADFPKFGRIDYIDGVVWADLTMEQLYSHNQVKTEITVVLGSLVRETRPGLFMADRMRLVVPSVGLSTEPDASFVSYGRLESGQVREVPGSRGGVLELEGTPDMVLEIVSDSSVEKDMENLPEQYRQAGLPEFWRVDVRGEQARFEILQWTEEGYQPRAEADDWWRSTVFGRSFKLTQQVDRRGQPCFVLEERA